MRKTMFARHRRPWFAGGTVLIASVQGEGHYLAKDAAAYEDGTVNYLSLPAVEIGLRHLMEIGPEIIHERVMCLTAWLLEALTGLRHGNGRPLVQVHGPTRPEGRGGTIAFNLLDAKGESLDIRRIEELANHVRISLRTGCFCNPGVGEVAYGLTPAQIAAYFRDEEGMSFQELRARVRSDHDKEIGAARISVGLASNFADAYRLFWFIHGFLDRTAAEVGTAEFDAAVDTLLRDSA
jgi:selenocysteine lyase/cysteine desulfurase